MLRLICLLLGYAARNLLEVRVGCVIEVVAHAIVAAEPHWLSKGNHASRAVDAFLHGEHVLTEIELTTALLTL